MKLPNNLKIIPPDQIIKGQEVYFYADFFDEYDQVVSGNLLTGEIDDVKADTSTNPTPTTFVGVSGVLKTAIIWKDNSLGDSLDINFTGMFEEGEAIIGTMERGLRKILGRKFDDEYTKNTVETLTVGELGLVE